LRIPPHPNVLSTLRNILNLLHALLVSLLYEMNIVFRPHKWCLLIADAIEVLGQALFGKGSAQEVVDVHGDLAFPQPEGGFHFELYLDDEASHAETTSEGRFQQRAPDMIGVTLTMWPRTGLYVVLSSSG
jgi:hypothetical protein